MYFDSHAHLDLISENQAELVDLLGKDFATGLKAIVQVSTKPSLHLNIREKLERENFNIFYACGLPHSFAGDRDQALTELLELAQAGEILAIGETGLDTTRLKPEPEAFKTQQELFSAQLDLANQTGLPLILHTREAEEPTLDLIKAWPGVRGVAHCFTGSRDFAWELVKRGWMISFSGILTFQNARNLRDLAAELPEEVLLIETDAPYLAPVPYRGRPNHPGLVRETARVLAEVRGVLLEEIAELTTSNAERFFGV